MEIWGRRMSHQIDFLCICVDGLNVAEMFGNMFKFKYVINGWIPTQSDMPTYGQLGCQGFIIVSENGQLISEKTSVFLQEGEVAFQKVERVLDRIVSTLPKTNSNKGSSPLCADYPYAAGCIAVLDGVASDRTINGLHCQVIKFNVQTGRFVVSLIDSKSSSSKNHGRIISVRPCSLAPLHVEEDEGYIESRKTSEGTDTKKSKVKIETSTTRMDHIEAPRSVGVESMDYEHEMCTSAINLLLAEPTNIEYLQNVIKEISNHFAHEETLLCQYLDGEKSIKNKFSSISSHLKDHARIIEMGQVEIDRITISASVEVNPEIAVEIALAFLQHAEIYDSVYEKQIPSSAN